MDFIFPIVLLLAVYYLARYLGKQGIITGPFASTPQLKKPTKPAQDWDEEYLRTEAAKHTVARIEPTKYWFKNNPARLYDGYRYYCSCGKSDYRMNLKWTEFSFEEHKKEMREAALAQLGRFK